MITIAVDVMGGDFGLSVTIPASLSFLKEHDDVHLILVGDKAATLSALSALGAPMSRITVHHATEIVEMDESPQSALKNKKDSSMRVAIDQVKEGLASAAVSAGNTGALMAMARYVLKTLPGINRPAIAKFLPSEHDHVVCTLDLGANVDCTPEQLYQFALLGTHLVSSVRPDVPSPRVGLLNVGSEEIKGTEAIKQCHVLLSESPLNFIGNIEGSDIFKDKADVIVCDGFVGNIVLKTIEGSVVFIAKAIRQEFKHSFLSKFVAILAIPVLKRFKQQLDPRRYNGAIFLGLKGIVIKSHGGTDHVGFAYALNEAYAQARSHLIEHLETVLLESEPEATYNTHDNTSEIPQQGES